VKFTDLCILVEEVKSLFNKICKNIILTVPMHHSFTDYQPKHSVFHYRVQVSKIHCIVCVKMESALYS